MSDLEMRRLGLLDTMSAVSLERRSKAGAIESDVAATEAALRSLGGRYQALQAIMHGATSITSSGEEDARACR